jgi:hypothetical protein
MALLGLVGYAVILAGSLLQVGGVPVGLWISLPGGLFELSIGCWLLARGATETAWVSA